uniref:Uncharacterized protein n=1 Tax=viral metagenome TaxID=1070528 RepID=A0A6M3KLV5_9ZZZZ
METEVIKKILEGLAKTPDKVITSNLGSGCHARKMPGTDASSYKVVIPGDTFQQAQIELHYLLFDLGVDIGLTVEELQDVGLK